MYGVFFVVLLFLCGLIGVVLEGRLSQRERDYEEAFARYPIAEQIVEDVAKRNRVTVRDLVRVGPNLGPGAVDEGLSRLETGEVSPAELEGAARRARWQR
jgi:hypothetical protein